MGVEPDPSNPIKPVVTKPMKREPVFNEMPIGVAGLMGVLLAAQGATFLVGETAYAKAVQEYGVTPARLESAMAAGDYMGVVLPMFTHQLLHGGLLHLVMNLAMLLQVGPIAERGLSSTRDGLARFLILFFVSGFCGALTYSVINPGSVNTTIGASGSISGVFAGFLWAALGAARPGASVLRPILSSAAVFLLVNVGLAALARVSGFLPIAWEAHLGGFVGGLLIYPVLARLGRPGSSAPM
jgi:membrane associated rhomboid family serine protease